MTNTLYIKAYAQYIWDAPNTRLAALIYFAAPEYYNNLVYQPAALAIEFGVSDNPAATPYPVFTDVGAAISYYSSSQTAALLSNINTAIGSSFYTAYDLELIDPPVHAALEALSTVASTGNYSDLLGKPSLFDGDYNSLLNKPSIPSGARTTSNPSISLVSTGATGTQIHATKDATIRGNLSTSTTSTIGGPSTSKIDLKICSTNNATEGSWTTVATLESDQTITLALVLNSIQVVKGQISADVPAGWYYKFVNSGTGTHTEIAVSAQQTIYG